MLDISYCADKTVIALSCSKVDGVKLMLSGGRHYLDGIKNNASSRGANFINVCDELEIRNTSVTSRGFKLGIYKRR